MTQDGMGISLRVIGNAYSHMILGCLVRDNSNHRYSDIQRERFRGQPLGLCGPINRPTACFTSFTVLLLRSHANLYGAQLLRLVFAINERCI
jgi:hypothetical protein